MATFFYDGNAELMKDPRYAPYVMGNGTDVNLGLATNTSSGSGTITMPYYGSPTTTPFTTTPWTATFPVDETPIPDPIPDEPREKTLKDVIDEEVMKLKG